MIIHLQSDTHTEMGPAIGQACASDVTICAGDNGAFAKPDNLARYFDQIRECCDDIIYVLGNHEFYHGNYDDTLTAADKFAKEHGIHLLDEALGTADLELDGVKFWGSTLWTDLKEADHFVVDKVGHGMNDYYVISKTVDGKEGAFTAHDTMEINRRTREKINYNADIIITHHCPIVVEHKRFPINDITYGFCNTGMESQLEACKAKYWVYGHTHDSRRVDINGTTVISNQQGYMKQTWQTREIQYEDAGFDSKLTIEI